MKAWFASVLAVGLLAIGLAPVRGDGTKRDALWKQATSELQSGDFASAERTLSKTIQTDPKFAAAYYHRGRTRFRLSRFRDSLSDFDRYVALRPALASRQWERGIACYYAGEYEKGAEQFKLYQTYHDNDVENSVWRFLCMAPKVGVAKARAALLPIRNDRRIPMMEVYRLFRGESTVWDVHAAVHRGNPSDKVLAYRQFYAWLYIGLYYESVGNEKLGRKYLLKAADEHARTEGINNYMWAVADVHAKRLRQSEADSTTP